MQMVDGQVVVVTGGASGIGLALARNFGARGMAVVVADVEQAALDEAVTKLTADGVDALGVVTDVRSEDAVRALADEAFAWKGHVNVVCNNAGVVSFGSAFSDMESWKWVIDVDLWGVVHGMHAFVPRMIESGQPGYVVNTASTAGLFGFPQIASYVAAKHAVVGMSQSMYHELAATSVGISVLCPGIVTTNIDTSHRNKPGTDPTSITKSTFGLDRPEAMTPEQVADVVTDAIEADRFWILPHEHYGQQAVDLATTRVDGGPPLMPKIQ
jgi:NAD(P)-dependent dehydrogenase (short-subunit alcohol dehydrogenase family)